MKKFFALSLALIISVGMTACGGGSGTTDASGDTQADGYMDGTYTSEMFFESDDGYQDNLTLTIAGGKITAVEWNGSDPNGGEDRRTASANGNYEISDWHDQAAKLEAKVIETQDPKAITLNEDGTPENVPGVTINAEFFVDLVDTALYDAIPAEE